MRIVICGSMVFARRMLELEAQLSRLGHEVVIPRFTHEYASIDDPDKVHNESVKNKIERDLIRDYFDLIKGSDAILVANYDKPGKKNYIGGNAFLEMGFAHVLNKKIFLLNPIPDNSYKDEIRAMQPIVLKEITGIC